jgi:hypothetical protein
MNRIKMMSILILLFSIVFTSDIQAQVNMTFYHGLAGLKPLMQTSGMESIDEQLGTEMGSMGNVPVDGGITLLLAAGMAYGGRRLAANRRKRRA